MVAREKPGPAMTLANMRKNGVHTVIATCQVCGNKADVNVDTLADTITVPKAGDRLRCTQCGGKRIDTRPAWRILPGRGAETRSLRPAGRRLADGGGDERRLSVDLMVELAHGVFGLEPSADLRLPRRAIRRSRRMCDQQRQANYDHNYRRDRRREPIAARVTTGARHPSLVPSRGRPAAPPP